MGTCFSSRRRTTPTPTPSWWSDLPPDLAGVVLRWLPSHRDRVRFAAVCRNWRIAAQQQGPLLPPPLPWISFNNDYFQSLCDGEQHALGPWRCPGGYELRCYSTFGGWILLEVDDPARSCVLWNPLSGKSMKLPPLPFEEEDWSVDPYAQYRNCSAFRKVISVGGGLIVAALFKPSMRENPKTIGICLPFTGASWALHTRRDRERGTWYEDVAFFRGKLYAVDNRGNLYAFDLATGGGGGSRPVVKVAHERCVIQQPPRKEETEPALAAAPRSQRRTTRRYLVVSCDNDKLLMVRWSIVEEDGVYAIFFSPVNQEPVMAFSVFQADYSNDDDSDSGAWEWSEVTSTGALEDQALFVSRSCSVALRTSGYMYAGAVDADGAGADVRGSRVFYLEDEGSASNARYVTYMGFGRKWNLRVCGVYDLRDRTAGRIRLWNGGETRWAEDRDGGDGEGTEFVPCQFSRYSLAAFRLRATWFLPHACT